LCIIGNAKVIFFLFSRENLADSVGYLYSELFFFTNLTFLTKKNSFYNISAGVFCFIKNKKHAQTLLFHLTFIRTFCYDLVKSKQKLANFKEEVQILVYLRNEICRIELFIILIWKKERLIFLKASLKVC
jgi:hypothetical protein